MQGNATPSKISDVVKRTFTESFKGRDIAEPFASFDEGASSADVRDFMEANGVEVVGLRHDGQIAGYVENNSLTNGACGQFKRPFGEVSVVNDDSPLLKVLNELNHSPFVFVTVLGAVGGIITAADLQKPPVRMWIFGVVTLIEMRFLHLIEAHCPDDSWKEFLSDGRLQKAQALVDERSRRKQRVRLLDCLQFSDKGQIVARHEAIRQLTIFSSRRQAEDAIRKLEQLRNNVAHAQDILKPDLETIVQLCEFITRQ